MPSGKKLVRRKLWLLSLLAVGCGYYAKPNRPVPSTFEAKFLDGALLDAQALRGKPTVIAIWAPK
jgi:hypothetical protein